MAGHVRRPPPTPVVIRGGAILVAAALVTGDPVAGQEPYTWSEFRSVERVEPHGRIAWGEGPHAFGELYRPGGPGPHPVVVLIHGGCWRSIADVSYVSRLGRSLAEAGWVVWSLEFRRIDQDGGAWPGILEDVAAGADHLRALAPEFDLDLERVVAVGHSSGGHLALWLAGRRRLPADAPGGPRLRRDDPLPVAGVVGLAAIADLVDFHHRGGGGCGPASVESLLDAPLAEAATRLSLTSPDALLPLGVPQLLVTGALDETVPADHGAAWVDAARAAGDDARLLTPAGAGHFEVVAPWTDPYGSVWPEIRAFLETLRSSPGAPPS